VILEGNTNQSHKAERNQVMKEKVRFLGLDVHAETIAVAIAEPDGEVRSLGTIANRAESIRKLVKKLGPVEQLKACYEAGPTGYVLYWQLAELGIGCEVIAPTLVPMKAGDRVKTDRRDAERLARSYRSGDLTPVWVPNESSEALRDLVRAREAAKQDQLRARHRLSKFLLRTGQRPAAGVKPWTQAYLGWVKQVHFTQAARESTLLDYLHEVEHMAERVKRLEQAIANAVQVASPQMQEVMRGLQALRGIAQISAVTLVAELGELSRFASARQLMGYSGAVPSEYSSGQRTRRGSITKTGNAHLRRIAIEAAWSYRLRPSVGPALRKRQEGVSEEIKEIAWKAQHRLHKRYTRLAAAGKDQRKIITAVGRELLGFIWAIGLKAEASSKLPIAA
jgi:transposase